MGTVDGQVLGTPAYMSPEQARGDDLTPASDVYAAGVMLYELLSGQLPWQGAESASELLSQRLREDPIPLRDVAPHVPQPIADVVMTTLSRDVETRYQRAEDLGVAIGEACADAWGADWLDHAGITVAGSERLSRAARTTTHRGEDPAGIAGSAPRAAAGPAPSTIAPIRTDLPGAGSTVVTARGGTPSGASATSAAGAQPVEPEGAHETVARPATPTGAPRAAPATGAVGAARPAGQAPAAAPPTHAPGSAPAFDVVRAVAEPRIHGADLNELELADLIGVEDVLDPPKPPWPALLATAGLFAAAALVAVLGLAGPDRTEGLLPGQVELDGVDVVGQGRIEVDLSRDVMVEIVDPDLAAAADGVELELGALGIPVTTVTGVVRDGLAILDPGIAQRTISGKAAARVVLLDGDEVVAEHELGVDATQRWYLTVPFGAAMLLLLFALANLESSLKPLRSGHRRFLSYVGAAIAGALAGLSLVATAGAVGFSEPTIPTAAVVTVLGAAGGAASARARIGVARRRRVRRAVLRAERTLGVAGLPVDSP
jgi:serine/threonine-protein kinase